MKAQSQTRGFLFETNTPLTENNIARELAVFLITQFPKGIVCWNSESFPDCEDDGFVFFITQGFKNSWDDDKWSPVLNPGIIIVGSTHTPGVGDPEVEWEEVGPENYNSVHLVHERDDINVAKIREQLEKAVEKAKA